MSHIYKSPKFILFLVGCLVCGMIGAMVLLRLGISVADVKALISGTIDYISQYPALVYLSLLLASGLPVPFSPFLILAGVTFTNLFGLPLALVICYSAIVLSMIWTYFVSAYPMRRLFERIIGAFASKFPEIPEEHQSKVALIIRITPGIPFFLQNYFLGVTRVPFVKYLVISMAIQAFYTTGFVVGGGALFEGKAGLAIAAASVLVILGIAIKWLRGKNKITQSASIPNS